MINQGDAFATKSCRDRPASRFEYTREAPLTIDFGQSPSTRRAGSGPSAGRQGRPGGAGSADPRRGARHLRRHRPTRVSTSVARGRYCDLPAGRPAWEGTLCCSPVRRHCRCLDPRDTLAFSQAGQRDYRVEVDADDRATVVFGDGIVRRGATNRRCAHRHLPRRRRTARATFRRRHRDVVDAPQLALLGATVTNPVASSGGAERETVDHAVQHAPAVFRSLHRAVTPATTRLWPAISRAWQRSEPWRQAGTGHPVRIAPEGGGKVSDQLEAGLRDISRTNGCSAKWWRSRMWTMCRSS